MASLRYGGFFIEDKVSLMLLINFNTAMEFLFHCCCARFRRCCFVSGVCPVLFIRPEIRRGYPLNLSILLSGGEENNYDSLSNGE